MQPIRWFLIVGNSNEFQKNRKSVTTKHNRHKPQIDKSIPILGNSNFHSLALHSNSAERMYRTQHISCNIHSECPSIVSCVFSYSHFCWFFFSSKKKKLSVFFLAIFIANSKHASEISDSYCVHTKCGSFRWASMRKSSYSSVIV